MYEPMTRNHASCVISLRKTHYSMTSHRLEEIKCLISTYYIHNDSDDDEHEKKRNIGQRMVEHHLAR